MAPKPPFDLVHNGRTVGTVVNFVYSSPVVIGRLVPATEALLAHYRASWQLGEAVERLAPDLPDEEADAIVGALCARLGVGIAEHRAALNGWEAHFPDGDVWEISRHPAFDDDGVVEWRW